MYWGRITDAMLSDSEWQYVIRFDSGQFVLVSDWQASEFITEATRHRPVKRKASSDGTATETKSMNGAVADGSKWWHYFFGEK